MRVHLGSDHAGLELKDHLMTWLVDHGYEPVDHGPFVYDALDDETKNNPIIYPDDATLAICESFINLPEETNVLVQDLWNEIITE